MEKNNQVNLLKNPTIIKDDLFTEYLNCNNFENDILNEEFINPNNETFDKFFNNDENSYKSLNSINDFSNANNRKSSVPDAQINELFKCNNNNLYNFKFGNGGYEKSMNEDNRLNESNGLNVVNTESKKKNIFRTLPKNKNSNEDLKQKKLLMNRESAKKSRLKKKRYIENLEKQYILLKEEFIKLRENQKRNDNPDSNSQLIMEKDNNNILNNEYNFKKDEKEIISNNLEKDPETINNYLKKQKQLLGNLLVNQIEIMTPIKIKAFQTKFLKLQVLDGDDSIEVIKKKINLNLSTIAELYGIENEDNNIPNNNLNFCIKKSSLAYQIYDFYKSIQLLIEKFETIYNNIENI
jgi:hypothetical protein